MKVKSLVALMMMLTSVKISCASDPTLLEKRNVSYASKRVEVLPLCALEHPPVEDKNACIIFVHPPKVGGTNLTFIMHAILGDHNIRYAVPRVEGVSPGFITPGWIGGMAKLKADPGPLPADDRLIFVSGHFPYGAHEYLPPKKTMYVSLLCKPEKREISSLNFDFQRGYVKREEAESYLLDRMIDNPQTRMIAGEIFMRGPCDERTLDRAKRNLENFLLVGVIEETNTFMQAFLSLFKLQPVAIGHTQVTADKVYETVSDELKAKLIAKHRFDAQLYEHVKDRWTRWKQLFLKDPLPIAADQKILTIFPEFANTKKPEFKTLTEITEYNAAQGEGDLVQVSQKHDGLKDSGKSGK
jgi:hypothetical protein